MAQLQRITNWLVDDWREEITISTHLRIAASVCVLSTGLLVGSSGGAVAAADSDTSGSTTNGPAQAQTPATGPLGGLVGSLRTTLQTTAEGVTGTLGALTGSGQPRPGTTKRPTVTFGGTPTAHGSLGPASLLPKLAGTVVSDLTAALNPGAIGATAPQPAPANPTALDSTTPASTGVPPSTAPAVQPPATPPSNSLPSVVNNLTAPLSDVVTVATQTVGSIPAVAASLTNSVAAPVTQVITSVNDLLVTVANNTNASLAQLPTDLSALLGVDGTTTAPTSAQGAGVRPLGPPAAVIPVVMPDASALPDILLPTSEFDRAPVALDTVMPTAVHSFTAAGTSHGALASDTSLLAPFSGDSTTLSIVEHALGAFVASASISALVAWALPGLGGLLATLTAGIRIGYRQAKAGTLLRATAIARFAGAGPLGVVRSGSLISLRPRGSRSVRQEPSRESRFLDHVA